MYTILVNHDNELIATQKQAIMQHSKLVDELRLLVPPDYDDLDMGAFNSAVIEYVSPVSKTIGRNICPYSRSGTRNTWYISCP